MSKTLKELAFLRDLYIETDWTERFTNLFDDNFKFTKEEKILYLNAGAGNHALALKAKLKKKDVEVTAVSENKELLKIAQAKADLIKAEVNFTTEFPTKKFDAVLADASLVKPIEVKDFLTRAVNLSNDQAAFFLPTAGSFGEIFSLFWETFFNADLLEKGAEVERLLAEIPTVSKIEELAESLNLTKIEAVTKTEFFEFENGDAFINSPLAGDFLFPVWLNFLSAKEKKQVLKILARTIDDDCRELTFRFSVKATLIVGEKKAEY